MNIKIEVWNGHKIRFVEKEPGEWWAVGIDVARALEYAELHKAISAHCHGGITYPVTDALRRKQETKIIPELDIYNLIFKAADQSRNKDIKARAIEFKYWLFNVLKTLRQASGLEGFQIFRILDKEHQKEAMSRLNSSLAKPTREHFIKANAIANRAVSSMYGYPKSLKKDDMSPDMLIKREPILDDTANLMAMKERFGFDFSVSQSIYNKYLA